MAAPRERAAAVDTDSLPPTTHAAGETELPLTLVSAQSRRNSDQARPRRETCCRAFHCNESSARLAWPHRDSRPLRPEFLKQFRVSPLHRAVGEQIPSHEPPNPSSRWSGNFQHARRDITPRAQWHPVTWSQREPSTPCRHQMRNISARSSHSGALRDPVRQDLQPGPTPWADEVPFRPSNTTGMSSWNRAPQPVADHVIDNTRPPRVRGGVSSETDRCPWCAVEFNGPDQTLRSCAA